MASILIVDDDPTVRLIARELLRDGDHAIVEAADGDLAMAVIEAVPLDLVVLDLLMPNKDGLEVLRHVKANLPHIRILAVSSGGRIGAVSYLETARVFGADEVMMKPLRLDSFANAVEGLLGSATASVNPWALSAWAARRTTASSGPSLTPRRPANTSTSMAGAAAQRRRVDW